MKRLRSTLVRTASVALLAAAFAPIHAAGAATIDMKIEAKDLDVLTDELQFQVKCASACTVALANVNVLRYSRDGRQLSSASGDVLEGSKRLRANRPAKFRIPLSTRARSHLQSAVKKGGYAVVQVAIRLNGREGPYRTAVVRSKKVPKPPHTQDDIVVDVTPKLSSKPARHLIQIKGVQTTDWRYDRNETSASGCTILSSGSGRQTLTFASRKAVVGAIGYRGRSAVLVPAKGPAPFTIPLEIDAVRDGRVEAGTSGDCPGAPVGGGQGGGGTPPPCRRIGSHPHINAQLSFTGRNVLALSIDPEEHLLAPLTALPDCPIEPFKAADHELDILDAVHRMADPGGRDGKVILIARARSTDQLGGGSTTTKVRWTVTFKRVGR